MLTNSFLIIIVDRNESKINLSKKRMNKQNQVKKERKQSEIFYIELKKTRTYLKQVLNQHDAILEQGVKSK